VNFTSGYKEVYTHRKSPSFKIKLDSLFTQYANSLSHCENSIDYFKIYYSRVVDYKYEILKERKDFFNEMEALYLKYLGKNDTIAVYCKSIRGIMYLRENEYKLMKSDLETSIELGMKTLNKDHILLWNARFNLALYYDWLNVESESIKTLQPCLDLVNEGVIKDPAKIFDLYDYLAGYFMELKLSAKRDSFYNEMDKVTSTMDASSKLSSQNYLTKTRFDNYIYDRNFRLADSIFDKSKVEILSHTDYDSKFSLFEYYFWKGNMNPIQCYRKLFINF
jgi:hypothetical protein